MAFIRSLPIRAALVLLTSPGLAATQPEPVERPQVRLDQLPSEVAAWANEERQNCRESEGRVTAETYRPLVADFNGDGRPDYALSSADTFECGAGNIYSQGAGGGAIWTMFISLPRGHVRTGAVTTVEDPAVATFEGKTVLTVSAGGPGAYERPYWSYTYGWNGREMTALAYYDSDGNRVNEDGTTSAGWVRATLPDTLPAGFYAESCWPPSTDPDGIGYLHLTGRLWTQFDGGSNITRIERNGSVRCRLTLAIEDEEGNSTPVIVNIETRAGGEFVVLADDRNPQEQYYTRCEDREVPAHVRSWIRRR